MGGNNVNKEQQRGTLNVSTCVAEKKSTSSNSVSHDTNDDGNANVMKVVNKNSATNEEYDDVESIWHV